ncbi:ferredoxin family protein [Xanthobacter dioxanivorans]|uniref:Ferredoxin n=2 Tax=Xanthobacter dioxanivorans TaxID=2528964 RepID=A0A974SM44_9HYPH|nr:ferredoxin family protein [Xanthobacter dioxanivorans]QRG09248.1 ferredoxin family protein [Xanthobacter dioxanivorans]
MPYVVTEECIRCKYAECVAVCPVDCFREGANMLVIDQTQCIDCGSCEPACPNEAIIPGIDDDGGRWAAFNQTYAAVWPLIKISHQRCAPADADDWKAVPDKLAKHFDPAPAARP